MRTACGLPAHSMVKFWELPFVPGAQSSCTDCSDKVTGQVREPANSERFQHAAAPGHAGARRRSPAKPS